MQISLNDSDVMFESLLCPAVGLETKKKSSLGAQILSRNLTLLFVDVINISSIGL